MVGPDEEGGERAELEGTIANTSEDELVDEDSARLGNNGKRSASVSDVTCERSNDVSWKQRLAMAVIVRLDSMPQCERSSERTSGRMNQSNTLSGTPAFPPAPLCVACQEHVRRVVHISPNNHDHHPHMNASNKCHLKKMHRDEQGTNDDDDDDDGR